MTKISRIPLDKSKLNLFLDDFWTAVASLKSKTEAKDFFSQFLTLTERKMLAKRFQIALMLFLDYDYKNIKNRLKVSEVTIAKVSNWLEENHEGLIEVVKRIISLKEAKLERLENPRYQIKAGVAQGVVEEVISQVKQAKKDHSLSD